MPKPLEIDRKYNRQMAFEIKEVDADEGVFTGYGSVFGEMDSYRDVVEKGAFKKTLSQHRKNGTMPAMLWQHNSDTPIGIYTDVKEDSHGLKVTGKIIKETSAGKDALALLKAGAVNGLSIGYRLKRFERDQDENIWYLKEVELWEVSLVTFPALGSARVNDVKSMLENGEMPTVREFEKFLKEHGFSRREAITVINEGFKAVSGNDATLDENDLNRDDEDTKGLGDALAELRKTLEK